MHERITRAAGRFKDWALIAIVAGIAISCRGQTPEQKAFRRYEAMELGYRTNSADGAVRVLTDYLVTLAMEESNHIKGTDYEMARAEAHERLFLIYRKTGDTNKMEAEFRSSMEWLDRFKRTHGITPTNFTYESLAATLERSERGLDIGWKKE